jgi:phage repressor protein C with HTH and peptisase S24 domain
MTDKSIIINALSKHYANGNDAEFARKIGITPQTLSNWKARNKIDYEAIYTNCVGLNPEWLFTGEGPITKESSQLLSTEAVWVQKGDQKRNVQRIPLYEVNATAGIVDLLDRNKRPHIPIDYITIPNLPKCDGALPVTGDSMYPLLKSGDIVLYKEVNDHSNIIWGEMYLIALSYKGDDFFFAKFIQRSLQDGFIRLVSQNQHHQDREFPISAVTALALIKASIRINTAF